MRKLLGYKLKEDFRNDKRIIKAACTIDGYENFGESISDGQVIYNDTSKLKQAGVMHWFEEVYEEEKFTGWAKDDSNSLLWMGYYDNNRLKYGFDASGDWFVKEETFPEYDDCNRKATTEEIQQALINEAKKRGFKEGVTFSNAKLYKYTSGSTNTIIGDFKYESKHLSVKGYGGYDGRHTIFKDGKWAEIIPTETLDGKTAIIDGVEYELKIKN